MEKKNNINFILLAFESFIENSSDIIFVKDRSLVYMCGSWPFAKLVGYKDRRDLSGKIDSEIFTPELVEKYNKDDMHVINSGKPIINNIEPIPGENGKKRFSSTCKYPIKNDDGEIVGLYGIARDVTAQIELEEERESRMLSEQMFDDVFEADLTENKMLRVESSRMAKKIGLKTDCQFDEALHKLTDNFVHKDYSEEILKIYNTSKLISDYSHGIKDFSHIVLLTTDGFNYRWIEFRSRIYYSRVFKTLRLISFLRDVDDEVRREERFRIKAETDALTGLFNRESIIAKIKNCIKSYGENQSHALLFIDLDNFKNVNDNFGHPCGDAVLREMAQKFLNLFSANDIIGRLGGDEFLILVKNIKCEIDVVMKIKEICEKVVYNRTEGNINVRVTCSVGVSMYRSDGKTFEQMYLEADKAMYMAKQSGKNQFAFYKE